MVGAAIGCFWFAVRLERRLAPRPTLILVHETEVSCRLRLASEGFAPARALEISSYLAQSTDIVPEFDAVAAECERRGIAFWPVELDEAARVLRDRDPSTTLVWTLTDGIAYFRGGAAPTLARLCGLPTFGADDSLFALCQDKFRSGAVLRALSLPVPKAGLARGGIWLVPPPPSPSGYFVKPNRLGAKIGIWRDSRCRSADDALAVSRRIFDDYRDDAIAQPYVRGRNVRASFLAVDPAVGPDAAGIVLVDSGSDFQTMADSLSLYGQTGEAAHAAGLRIESRLEALAQAQPLANNEIRRICAILMKGLGLRDVFSADFRVDEDNTVHLLEFEVCPGLPCFDFRDYCRRQWNMSLAEAMAEAAARRLVGAGAQPSLAMQTGV